MSHPIKVLITGSNGFIGSHLVEKLLTQHYHIKCLVRKTSNLKWIRELPVEFVYGDITDFNSLLPATAGVDYIYHLGGILRVKNESDFFRVNGAGTTNLLEACRQQNSALMRFIYLSSQAAAGPGENQIPLTEVDPSKPISSYGKSKLVAEQVVLDYQTYFPVTIIRPPSVYGPRDDDILQLFKYIKFGIKPLIGNKEKKISIIYVHDLVRGIHLAAEHPDAMNEIFFMANPKGYSWIEIEDAIAQAMNKKAIVIRLPEFILDMVATISEGFARIFNKAAIINRDKASEMKQNSWLVDSTRAAQKLGFVTPTPLEQGIAATYQWYRGQGWL